MPVILAPRRLKQEDLEIEASLGYLMRDKYVNEYSQGSTVDLLTLLNNEDSTI